MGFMRSLSTEGAEGSIWRIGVTPESEKQSGYCKLNCYITPDNPIVIFCMLNHNYSTRKVQFIK